jgi:hypothetical protein
MRTSLFVPALFAVALAGSSALAEKPHRGVADRIRSRGDVVDKAYHGARHDVVKLSAPRQSVARPLRQAASRMSCSEMGVDCNVRRHGGVREAAAEAKAVSADHGARPPAFLAKVMGSDRTSFNEAGVDQGMSARAAKRAWSKAATGGAGSEVKRGGDEQKAAVGVPASGNRMSCNDAGECTMSSKAAKKQWAYQAVRAGTWRGPEAKSKTPAEHAIEQMKKEKNDPNKR